MTNKCYATSEEGPFSDIDPAEVAFELEPKDGEIVTIYEGDSRPVVLKDLLGVDLESVSDSILDGYYDIFEEPPEYEPFPGVDADKFNDELRKVIAKYWTKPKWDLIVNVKELIMIRIGDDHLRADTVFQSKLVHSGQPGAYAYTYDEYQVTSDRSMEEVKRYCTEYLRVCNLSKDQWESEDVSMENHFRSYYRLKDMGEGQYEYRVTFPYSD